MTHAEETIAAAAQLDHPWDARALDWPLTRESVVVEVGGYKGRWALQIAERYAPRLYVFEPQPWAARVCREVLGNKAQVLALALGTTSGVGVMSEWETDGCSLIKGDAGYEVAVAEIGGAFHSLGLSRIDLMLMNIEGYEYTLIPHMLDRGILPQRLMVQFHTFADPSGVATGRIYDRLAAAGYTIAWSYGVVLTAWERAPEETNDEMDDEDYTRSLQPAHAYVAERYRKQRTNGCAECFERAKSLRGPCKTHEGTL